MVDLSCKEFSFKSFVDSDLRKANLSRSKFIHCDFTNANLEEADCSYSWFGGSDFTNANLRYTNFARSDLQGIKFFPRDAYGIIFSLECTTFKNMKISRQWWYCYKFFALMMLPEKDKTVDPRDADILSMGDVRYRKLTALFRSRGF